ncbi:MAG: 1-phosphofructokinase family hexose kinase [Sphingobacteriales bacterium]|nr:MAG: 1-phosphofructokinase family hexose kinase [Sphingobacteriales bacterium]
MVATVTLNPAIDKSTGTDKIQPEKKVRCTELLVEAGGGGINVSKAIRKLGGESLALFTSGGRNGALLKELLDQLSIPSLAIPVDGETRENFSVAESSTNAQYRFVMPGPSMNTEQIEQCLQALEQLPASVNMLVVSGSMPSGVPETFLGNVAAIARKKQLKLLIDSSGAALSKALEVGVYMVKPNLSELSQWFGREELELHEVEEAAMQLVKDGKAKVVVVSLGPAGALLVSEGLAKRIQAPTVKKKSTIGAGDSMVAGMAWMLSQQKSLEEVVMFGVACGTAATMNAGTALFEPKDVYRLYDWIRANHG